jgi:hypothetical protein
MEPNSISLFHQVILHTTAPVVKWSEFLATDPEVRVWFPALSDFLSSSASGLGPLSTTEYNWGATWKNKSSDSGLENR